MPFCEICGREAVLCNAIIEGAGMSVCGQCSLLGRKLIPIRPVIKVRHIQRSSEEIPEDVVDNYAELVRKAREKLNLKQEELAKKINEKESIIHKLETSQFKPSLELARKLERFLDIVLVKKVAEEHFDSKKIDLGTMTLGDLIKFS